VRAKACHVIRQLVDLTREADADPEVQLEENFQLSFEARGSGSVGG
jgi:hypothetical protein